MTALAISLFVLVLGVDTQIAKPAFGTCERLGRTIVGERPGKPSAKQFPRKRSHVNPALPQLPEGSTVSGIWAGEALVRTDGTIARVWALREPQVSPAFPAFAQSIVAAVERWTYEPWAPAGRATPFCVTITMNVDH